MNQLPKSLTKEEKQEFKLLDNYVPMFKNLTSEEEKKRYLELLLKQIDYLEYLESYMSVN